MKIIEKFFIPLEEQLLTETIFIGKKVLSALSVNNSYSISKEGETKRSKKSLGLQESMKQVIGYLKKSPSVFKKKVMLKMEFNQAVPLNKNKTIDRSLVVDIDNPLKHVIDSLSGLVISDDNLVYGLLVNRKFNVKPYSYINITVYQYDSNEFSDSMDKIKDKYSSIFVKKIPMENMKIPSFNSSYDNVPLKGGKFKKVLNPEVKEYKKHLGKIGKEEAFIDEPSEDTVVFLLRAGISNPEDRDLDNMFKATLDAFTKVLYKDDKQIDTIIAMKEPAKVGSEYIYVNVLDKGFSIFEPETNEFSEPKKIVKKNKVQPKAEEVEIEPEDIEDLEEIESDSESSVLVVETEVESEDTISITETEIDIQEEQAEESNDLSFEEVFEAKPKKASPIRKKPVKMDAEIDNEGANYLKLVSNPVKSTYFGKNGKIPAE